MDQERIFQALRNAMMQYGDISLLSWEQIKNISRIKSFKKGVHILRTGVLAKNLHFIYQGAIRAYFTDKEGNIYNKNLFLENEFSGSTVSLLTGKPSAFGLETLEDTILINIDYLAYRSLIKENKDLNAFYIAYLEKNWVIKKEAIEVSIVMNNAMERYLALLQQHPDLNKRIPQYHIASHLGITPTQLSRIKKEIKSGNQHM